MATADLFPEQISVAPWDLSEDVPAELTDAVRDLVGRYRATRLADSMPPQFKNRFYKALTFNLPFLWHNLPRHRARRILDVGCGKGAKSFPLSLIADTYTGVDISPGHVRDARGIAQRIGTTNVEFEVVEAADVESHLHAHNVQFDLIVLYAVLEHLTIEEKLGLLGALWAHLADDGLLYIGEAPNRMFPIDYHSTKSLFFQQMPLDLWPHYLQRVRNERWRRMLGGVIDSPDWTKVAYRHGVHVGHQEFDLAVMEIEALPGHIVSDSFDSSLLNLYPYTWYEFLKLAELRSFAKFASGVAIEPREFPDFFSRYYLEALFQKGATRARRPSAVVTWPVISGSADLFADERFLTVTGNAPHIQYAEGAGREINLTVQIQNPMGASSVLVRAADGRVLQQFSPRSIVRSFAQRRRSVCVRLPAIAFSYFPISFSPAGDDPLRLGPVFETG